MIRVFSRRFLKPRHASGTSTWYWLPHLSGPAARSRWSKLHNEATPGARRRVADPVRTYLERTQQWDLQLYEFSKTLAQR